MCVALDAHAGGSPPSNAPNGNPPACESGGSACKATRAADFVDSWGVVAHLNSQFDTPYSDTANGAATGQGATSVGGYTTNVSAIARALNYTGIYHLRGGMGAGYDSNAYVSKRFANLSPKVPNLGGLYGIDTDGTNAVTTTQINNQIALIGGVVPISQVDGVEGPNEWAGFRKAYNGNHGTGAECQLYADMRPVINSKLGSLGASTPVLAGSVGGQGDDAYAGAAFDIQASTTTFYNGNICSTYNDAGNGHPYSDWNPPTAARITEFAKDRRASPSGAPVWSTEFGSSTNGSLNFRTMDERTGAVLNLEQLLTSRNIGYFRNYLYELVDENNLNDSYESFLGQFHSDWSPKQGANALHNVSIILSDPACAYNTATNTPTSCAGTAATTFTTGSITYSLSNAPAQTFSFLMQKSDGTYVLAVWAEPSMWTGGNGSPIVTGNTTVTVNLPPMSSISVTDPFGGSPTTPTTLPPGTTAAISISDHPVFLTMVASGATGGGGGGGGIGVCTFGGGAP